MLEREIVRGNVSRITRGTVEKERTTRELNCFEIITDRAPHKASPS